MLIQTSRCSSPDMPSSTSNLENPHVKVAASGVEEAPTLSSSEKERAETASTKRRRTKYSLNMLLLLLDAISVD